MCSPKCVFLYFRPHLRWGTQEMIWPIKKETLERGSTERLDLLALPKVNFMKGDKINRFVSWANTTSMFFLIRKIYQSFLIPIR